jgi:hypothetical protein
MEIEGIEICEFYPFRELTKLLPGRRRGEKVSERTLERWRDDGVQRGNCRVKLHVIRLGNDWFTCDTWVKDFVAACNAEPANTSDSESRKPRTPSQRDRVSANARAQLDDLWTSKKKRS